MNLLYVLEGLDDWTKEVTILVNMPSEILEITDGIVDCPSSYYLVERITVSEAIHFCKYRGFERLQVSDINDSRYSCYIVINQEVIDEDIINEYANKLFIEKERLEELLDDIDYGLRELDRL